MLTRKLLFTFYFCVQIISAQQNEHFKNVKGYYDYQRFILKESFQKKYDAESNAQKKVEIKKDFAEFMVKMDSIQNMALIAALIKVKNNEDLNSLFQKGPFAEKIPEQISDEGATYPGGFGTLRQQVADLFYFSSVVPSGEALKTTIAFVVERDGSITSVHAQGENFIFNRQAEIAVYLLPEKFSPAKIQGKTVRHRFKMPLSMNFD